MWIQRSPATRTDRRATQLAGGNFLLDSFDRVVSACGLEPRPFSATELVDSAIGRTGLTDFGDSPFEEPLRILTKSYDEEAGLSVFGRLAARWDMQRFLCNLLLLRRAEKERPAILDQPIAAPVFITGLPRSATTFLHRCWQTLSPCPKSGKRSAIFDWRAAKVDRQLDAFAWLAPEVRRLHPLTARSPQECTEITAHVFRSLRFDTTHHVPTYRRWLDESGHVLAYRFHRRFLQHLQHGTGAGGPWILKSPDHVFALDAIRQIYPDARFIFVHRSPLEVLASVAELTEVLRRPFTREVDRKEIGRQVSDRWAHGAELLVEAAQFRESPDAAHLEFREVVRHPVRTVASLYDRFGLKFSHQFAARLGDFIAAWPNKGYRRDKIEMEQYGLRRDVERRRYRRYLACFGVEG